MIIDGYKWLDINLVNLDALKDALTKDNPKYIQALNMDVSVKTIPPKLFYYYIDNKRALIRVPRGFDVTKYKRGFKYDKVNYQINTSLGTEVKFNSKIILRENQITPVKILNESDDTIISMPCGAGKTVVALEAIANKGRTTLVLVHKNFLMNQWKDRIKEFLGEDAGVIGNGKEDWRGKKIVVGMIQSLLNDEKYDKELFKYFGLVVTDEVHRTGSFVWSQVIGKFNANWRWGLTATPTRADGMEFVFKWNIGEVSYIEEEQEMKPDVNFIKSNFFIPPIQYTNNWNKRINMAKLITEISKDKERNELILNLVKLAGNSGRKILVLGDRVKQLKELKIKIKSKDYSSALYLGETSDEDRKKAENADIILATSQMASEGLDIPSLDTLFLITPKGGKQWLQQAVGRIQREFKGKKKPMVVDIIDRRVSILVNLSLKREAYYRINKFNIKE